MFAASWGEGRVGFPRARHWRHNKGGGRNGREKKSRRKTWVLSARPIVNRKGVFGSQPYYEKKGAEGKGKEWSGPPGEGRGVGRAETC